MQPRYKLRQPLVPILILVLLGLQYWQSSRAYTILLYTFGGIFIMSYIWSRALGKGIQFQRETLMSWAQVGRYLEENLSVSNNSGFPAPHIELIDHSTLPGFDASRAVSVNAEAVESWTARVFCQQRGLFHLGDAQLITSDPLGIFDVMIHVPKRTPMLVLPRPSILPKFTVASSGIVGDGQPRRDSTQQSIHVSTVREFVQGDGMRHIHWPTTARRNKPFVRLMENAPEGKWWIVLDLDQAYMRGRGWDSIEEQGIALTASLSDFGMRSHKSTGLVCNAHEFGWLPPQKADTQGWQILQTLALAKPGTLSLEALFDRTFSDLGHDHSLLIVTACTEVGWIRFLPSLTKRGLFPTVFLMDSSSFDGQDMLKNAAMKNATSTLAKQRVRHHIVPRGMIKPPHMEPISTERSVRDATPTGPVFPVKNP
jgi:uncharacterized protein (DUF58 family)